MGRDPNGLYHTEMDFLNGLVAWFKPRLRDFKDGTMGTLKIETIKIALVLENGVHMHKDIDFGGL